MTDQEQERLARVALGRLFEPGDRRVTGPLESISAVRLLEELTAQHQTEEVRHDIEQRLAALDAEGELERADKLGIRFIIPGDPEWPKPIDDLLHVGRMPEGLGVPFGMWVKGPLRLNELQRSIAIVGSRSCTTYGVELACEISAKVSAEENCVVSGAAFGIDEAAHRGALSTDGQTVAVLACGLDRVYPASHANMIRWIGEHGALVSEMNLGCAPMRLRFLSRNRLIAGLSLGTVVVEAAARSGALSTGNWATRLSRPLMGVPGPVTSAASEGVHNLIRTGAATLVTSGDDVLEVVGSSGQHLLFEPRGPERPRDRLTRSEMQVLDAVPATQAATEESIARTAGMSLRSVTTALRTLATTGFVVQGEGGWGLTGQGRQ